MKEDMIQFSGGIWGLELRDYFAAAALPGLLGRRWEVESKSDADIIRQWGKSAYAVADAMLAARKP